MENTERWFAMAQNLKAAELRVRREQLDLTHRAEVYMSDGLPLGIVLGALGISRATWYRRVRENAARYEQPVAPEAEDRWVKE
jgi:hypothetical protein